MTDDIHPAGIEQHFIAPAITQRKRLISDLVAVRAHHAFTRDCIGQPGCEVRKAAAEYVETLDAAIAALQASDADEMDLTLLDDVFEFLGGVDDAAELRGRILTLLTPTPTKDQA